MADYSIHTEYIQLNQLLKLLNWAESGAEANNMIASGLVKVNGEKEFRKRNKIYPGMTVEISGQKVTITAA